MRRRVATRARGPTQLHGRGVTLGFASVGRSVVVCGTKTLSLLSRSTATADHKGPSSRSLITRSARQEVGSLAFRCSGWAGGSP